MPPSGQPAYRKTVLSAEVGTNRRSYVLASEQYRHGMTNFLNVLDSERRVLRSETDFAEITSTVSSDLVRLYLALGGGWERVFPLSARG